jgi:pimeloyl-ACP methyl ester carboxylesterase
MPEFVEIQGELLAVQVFEPKQHRGDALLIHGYTGSKEDFIDIGPLLAERGYRVVTFDNRGQHESPHSQREDAYSIASLARDAIALTDHFGMQHPHLLGHSFGGLVAQRAAVLAPSHWASLTIFCSGPGAIPNVPELPMTIDVLETMSMPEAWDKYRDLDAQAEPTYELMKRRWAMSDPRSVITHAKHLVSEPSIIAEVRATGLPTYVVYGENDDAWPLAMQDEMAAELGAPVTVIANAGHCPNEDQPAVTAMVLADFWDRA